MDIVFAGRRDGERVEYTLGDLSRSTECIFNHLDGIENAVNSS
jgi:hypothetical protein